MSFNHLLPGTAFRKGSVKFKAKQISSNYTEEDQSRISGKFVLAVIAVIILEILVYQLFPFNQTAVIISIMAVVFIGYFFMNQHLTSYQYIGTILFSQDHLEFSNREYNQTGQINYVDIVQIRGEAGVPHQVFRGKNQPEEFKSVKITFILSDYKEISSEIYTKLELTELENGLTIHHIPHLEALLKELYSNYQVVDKIAYKHDRDWEI